MGVIVENTLQATEAPPPVGWRFIGFLYKITSTANKKRVQTARKQFVSKTIRFIPKTTKTSKNSRTSKNSKHSKIPKIPKQIPNIPKNPKIPNFQNFQNKIQNELFSSCLYYPRRVKNDLPWESVFESWFLKTWIYRKWKLKRIILKL